MNPIEQLHREIDQLPVPLAQEALDLLRGLRARHPLPAEPRTTLIGPEALRLAEKLGFVGCLDAEPELSETYKAHLDWSDKT
ncbi:hypothetical protein SAMN02949497_4109 [Methylomagnum ishizawai]|uniref:Uncharacterized protein n=1 Tax=Methylomagnum ishizawai TaxID=1760988 RepID=A0A1Y6D7D7_9GAMM|nr:hypothetical protein [Methylomagnum ishizawai]SMF96703.1 hypothetical protein SAMN02949497_4109 [Methylomagnum ishizawai]